MLARSAFDEYLYERQRTEAQHEAEEPLRTLFEQDFDAFAPGELSRWAPDFAQLFSAQALAVLPEADRFWRISPSACRYLMLKRLDPVADAEPLHGYLMQAHPGQAAIIDAALAHCIVHFNEERAVECVADLLAKDARAFGLSELAEIHRRIFKPPSGSFDDPTL